MYVYMTNGTYEFLQKLKAAYPKEPMILMTDMNTSLLLHETNSETEFKEPRKFEVIDKFGNLINAQYFVMNHIPVTDEGRPLFEHRFKHRERLIEKQRGFVGIRVLRPIANNTYVILTAWEDEEAFNGWKSSSSFGKSHHKKDSDVPPRKIFSAPSYTTKYWIPDEDINFDEDDDWN